MRRSWRADDALLDRLGITWTRAAGGGEVTRSEQRGRHSPPRSRWSSGSPRACCPPPRRRSSCPAVRELRGQAQTMAGLSDEAFRYDQAAADTDFWFDYASDVGDGFDSTYAIADLLAQPLALGHEGAEPVKTERGRLLVLGGDQVYPTANWQAYEERFRLPYGLALPDGRAPAAPVRDPRQPRLVRRPDGVHPRVLPARPRRRLADPPGAVVLRARLPARVVAGASTSSSTPTSTARRSSTSRRSRARPRPATR